ncbi:hypothetical protein [Chondromyces apiculatus]|uniref:Uncharacterized protein n=1 Tax=Chondromyces apiculatus DSM 436 TaxID=1192034 RepID=A0A017T8S1_9BACT|nr:hypothetical protein [Chondromyces apiculatus]EYF04996.1 Hypothetical protein CAP_3807 [Chondromyces apiculatus DSM 436]
MNSIVFPGLDLDDTPMEEFRYLAHWCFAMLTLDTSDGSRVELLFTGTLAHRFQPAPVREHLRIDGAYPRTLMRRERSPWMAALARKLDRTGDVLPQGLKHYVVPTNDGVWECLALDVVLR